MKSKAFLLIGGNMGDRLKNLSIATDLIQQTAGNILQSSTLYETAAWGITDQPRFLNQVLHIETEFSAMQLLNILLDIEESIGRKRVLKFGPRSIDIDILFYNDDTLKTASLVIPHPEMQNRKFVLVPLNEIAPTFKHPVFHKNITQLLQECNDDLEVKKFNC